MLGLVRSLPRLWRVLLPIVAAIVCMVGSQFVSPFPAYVLLMLGLGFVVDARLATMPTTGALGASAVAGHAKRTARRRRCSRKAAVARPRPRTTPRSSKRERPAESFRARRAARIYGSALASASGSPHGGDRESDSRVARYVSRRL